MLATKAMWTLGALMLFTAPLAAQGRGRGHDRDDDGDRDRTYRNSQGIPPGQMPPAGMCRVWIDGVPPGRQPAPTNCAAAEAMRPRNGRVIYGAQAAANSSVFGRWDAAMQRRRAEDAEERRDAMEQQRIDEEQLRLRAERDRLEQQRLREQAARARRDHRRDRDQYRKRDRDDDDGDGD